MRDSIPLGLNNNAAENSDGIFITRPPPKCNRLLHVFFISIISGQPANDVFPVLPKSKRQTPPRIKGFFPKKIRTVRKDPHRCLPANRGTETAANQRHDHDQNPGRGYHTTKAYSAPGIRGFSVRHITNVRRLMQKTSTVPNFKRPLKGGANPTAAPDICLCLPAYKA